MGLFKRRGLKKIKAKKVKNMNSPIAVNSCEIVLKNAYIDIVYTACKECYKGKIEDDLEKKAKYIEAKVRAGHESVIEHSNIVMMLRLNPQTIADYAQVVEYSDFLKFHSKRLTDNSRVVLIGGSILGYKQLIRRIPDLTNPVLRLIIGCLYEVHKSFFYDLIEDGVMEERKFDQFTEQHKQNVLDSPNYELIEFTNVDDINELRTNTKSEFKDEDLFKFISATIYFKDMSRVITQQLTRHRNAISQKSQRYVSELNPKFNSPVRFREDNTEVIVEVEGKQFTSQKLGEYYSKVLYEACVKAGMKNEEARSYLLNNVSSSLFITFSGYNLIHFLKMRCDKHAQNEIRMFANIIYDVFKPIFSSFYEPTDIYNIIEPLYKRLTLDELQNTEEPSIFEEVISEEIISN